MRMCGSFLCGFFPVGVHVSRRYRLDWVLWEAQRRSGMDSSIQALFHKSDVDFLVIVR